MKELISKILSSSALLLLLSGAAGPTVSVFAEELSPPKIESKGISTTAYFWKVDSKTTNKYYYGGWQTGPIGKGPATLSVNQSSSLSRSVSASICDSYPAGQATIGGSLGVTIGKSYTYGTSYSITVPKSKRYQIIVRPYFKQVKVVQRQWIKTGTVSSKTPKTAVAYVNIFQYWDYSYKVV